MAYRQAQLWMKAGSFEAVAHDLRELSRLAKNRKARPTPAIMDGRTLQSSPESGARAGYDGYKRNGSKVHITVDTLRHLLALNVTAAREQERAQVTDLATQIQEVAEDKVELAYVDDGHTGEKAAEDAQAHGIKLEVVKLSEAKNRFVLLSKRWVVERSFGWAARFRRLSRDYERLASTLAGMH